ncbi:unnamed protein product [Arctia plantaginis]|uniref:Small acidic protein-like domain-containing protein n=1 Tax=Arctia plantaginis TaxID=874455 RepID=A0A8S1AL19_ARCPL|nr:unnamed protein product [Arctia plantaginis]
MDSLVGYGSDDENESERYGSQQASVGAGASCSFRRRDDDTNYDDVNMDMSEDSQDAESEPELPPAEPPSPQQPSRDQRRGSNDSRERDRERDREFDRKERRRESPGRSRSDRERSDRRSPRRDERYRSDRDRTGSRPEPRRGLLGDRPDDKVPALMDLKPFAGDLPTASDKRSQDARDAVSPRFVDRDRRDRDRDRERERDRDRHGRRSEEKRSSSHRHDRRDRSRSRSRGAPHSSSHSSGSSERRSPSGDYRPSSYKVNKKLEVMEKMGLQIKTPDGSMATAQQLRAAAHDAPSTTSGGLPSYYNPSAVNASKILNQVQKRKLLWGNKNKTEAEEAAKWSGTRFAQDTDGKQVTKFMRLMGIKEPAAVNETPDKTADPIKKQEDLFQAMQAQYEVARATTHTMRGVGLGLQIKTPDASMATAQQLRAAAHDAPSTTSGGLPSYYNPSAVNASKILNQVQKRKLLWGNKNKTEAEEAAKWSGTRFAQDTDGKQVTKFMRLMGIKEPAAVNETPDKTADPIKKQEDLFQAMQAQYEVARATTHTMRGVGLGLQIKTPDASMATAQQLRAAAHDAPSTTSGGLPSYYNPSAVNASKILNQVQKRKLLWGNKNKTEAEEAAKWSGTRFAQDTDGKQVTKFMRLMGIKEPAAVNETPDKTADPIKKQEDLFQAMQAQYEVARATTHTMRGVGLGFQRGQY